MTARTRRQQTRGGLEMRRVVCGVRDGRSVVLADGTAPTEHGFKALPGHVSAIMWATAADPSPGQVAEAAPVGIQAIPGPGERSEERRVGKECVSTGSSWWST